jgi:LmbE family N-acetylglucosaminyl deacetylase
VEILGYRDSGMAGAVENSHPDALSRAQTDDVAGQVAEAMARHRPQVILTHDATGGYGHPDHIAVHRAVIAAWERYPDVRPRKLYFVAVPRALLRFAVRVMPLIGIDPTRVGANRDINLNRMAAQYVPVTARINVRRYVDAKQRAVACHASQLADGGSSMRLAGRVGRLLQWTEAFYRAFPPVSTRERVERDLFQGLT